MTTSAYTPKSTTSADVTSALFDLVEEPLNEVARAIEVRAEADGVHAIALGWDVGPCALLVNERPDPVCIIATVCQGPSSFEAIRPEVRGRACCHEPHQATGQGAQADH